MTAATVTHSGSMGKTYTATAVMQLVERGILGLDEPVNRYLPGWKIVNPRLKVLPEELPIIYLELGGRGGLPQP